MYCFQQNDSKTFTSFPLGPRGSTFAFGVKKFLKAFLPLAGFLALARLPDLLRFYALQSLLEVKGRQHVNPPRGLYLTALIKDPPCGTSAKVPRERCIRHRVSFLNLNSAVSLTLLTELSLIGIHSYIYSSNARVRLQK